MRFICFLTVTYLTSLLLPVSVFAQLSQLEFDHVVLKKAAKARSEGSIDKNRARLKKPELESESKKLDNSEQESKLTSAILKAVAQEKLIDISSIEAQDENPSADSEDPRISKKVGSGMKIPLPLEGEENSGYAALPPSLKGPKVDESDPRAITSAAWDKGAAQECWLVESTAQLQSKSKAVQEVLMRFSGSSDFYDGMIATFCAPECEGKDGNPEITGFSIVDGFGGEFKIEGQGSSCSYQLRKSASNRWPIYQVDKIVCHCLE